MTLLSISSRRIVFYARTRFVSPERVVSVDLMFLIFIASSFSSLLIEVSSTPLLIDQILLRLISRVGAIIITILSLIKELKSLLETLIVPRFLCHAFLRYRAEHPKLTQDVDYVNLFLELLVTMDH